MKKIIALLLSALMVFSVMGVASAAIIVEEVEVTGQCTHDHTDEAPCHCCLFCPNIDIGYLTTCAKNQGDGTKYDGSLCCDECTGMWPCSCGCSCCLEDSEGQDKDDDGNKLDEIITDTDRDNFVAGFQSILKVISDWFDKIFDAIFEFLRFDEVVK